MSAAELNYGSAPMVSSMVSGCNRRTRSLVGSALFSHVAPEAPVALAVDSARLGRHGGPIGRCPLARTDDECGRRVWEPRAAMRRELGLQREERGLREGRASPNNWGLVCIKFRWLVRNVAFQVVQLERR